MGYLVGLKVDVDRLMLNGVSRWQEPGSEMEEGTYDTDGQKLRIASLSFKVMES